MKKNVFLEEMKRRDKEDDNAYSMIGTELKRVRTSQSQTLSSIAGNLCSVSYLCKIENAQLKPNRYMLNEICKKLNVESPKITLLFELKNLLNQIVKHYYDKEYEAIDAIYEKCQAFDNYRTKLIFLIYYISKNKFDEANYVSKELFKITSVMQDEELSIFMVFHSILLYYEENYVETIDNLRQMSNLYDLEDTLGKTASLVCLECYLKMNSPMTLLHSHKLLELFLKTSEYQQAEYVRYLQALYMIQNNMLDCVYKEIKYIQTLEYRNTLEFYFDIQKKEYKNKEEYQHLRPFAKLIYTYIFDSKNYLNVFCGMDKNLGYACDFSYNIANYLTLSDDLERYSELSEMIIPNIKQTNNLWEHRFFLKEFCRICSDFSRYKSFCKAYKDLNGGEEI
ncbi:MAG: hypothetical protein K2N64_00460 [Anaeroplasmataceae bacterium]|nr:hypothetical protein [Anaeroplasmataceae bacterium]